MRMLYVGLWYDYGDPARGFSYEHVNFYDTLVQMNGVHVEFFPFDAVMREAGCSGMNKMLLKKVDEFKPDLCFFVLFTDEIKRDTIRQITRTSHAITLNWFGDDHWRFKTFSRHYAPCFHSVVTTDSEAVDRYKAIGCDNVIKTQWGFNHFRRVHIGSPQEFDVTFVGQVHSNRRRIVERMRAAGIDVRCWGRGWETGKLSQEEMISSYSRSKINLNFTESSVVLRWKPVAKVFLNRRADDSIVMNSPRTMWDNLTVLFGHRPRQIKGRNFEIPGYGGFLLTGHADNIEEYFVPDKEIALFSSTEELIDKVRYYLAHEDEREAIRQAGYHRALREHTYEHRFRNIFEALGLDA